MNGPDCLIPDLPVSEWFAPVGMRTRRGYVSGYRPKEIGTQLRRLRVLFPTLGCFDETVCLEALPQHAEGWFVIPRWQAIASTYHQAVGIVVSMLKATRRHRFRNSCRGKLGPERLRQTKESAQVFARIDEAQKKRDILVIPAQFGLLHHGMSVRNARASLGASEFGLGMFAAGIMLLTHPERLMCAGDLWIDCLGDAYDDTAISTRFDHTPCFAFRKGSIILSAHWSGYDCPRSSSCTGFFKT